MPKDPTIKSVLVIGSGPIVIGQACEFDYSGTQACRVLKSEGIRVILVNSNPATIMTDPEFADATYIEPITTQFLEEIIAKELPDAILATLGGQTALNAAIGLHKAGLLEKYNTKLIGADVDAIERGENREIFRGIVEKIGGESAKSVICHTMADCLQAVEILSYPVVVRPSFTMGGLGSGIAFNPLDLELIAGAGLRHSPTSEVLLEESILGWKEFELEVMRDHNDNVVIVCSIENIDPMGVHTGDSITVAPALTLTDVEFQKLRNLSIEIIREVGVATGGCNIQFAINPTDGRIVVIEMNPRVSRSSALASKATGFPIAKIATKLAIGYSLDEIKNDITKMTPASFEPTLDYIVVKVPRFAFEKFPEADPRLTTTMKSVGEAMAIGRSFPEALQKALRSLEKKGSSFSWGIPDYELAKLLELMQIPTELRLRQVQQALHLGASVAEVHSATRIDIWFLSQIKAINDLAAIIAAAAELDRPLMLKAKRMGFSDFQLAELRGVTEDDIRRLRDRLEIRPVYKTVDTCAAEFEAFTPYHYSSYEDESEVKPRTKPAVIILGSGPNRIGQGIEFDYSCVHASFTLSDAGYETIMINCNPETVSTDFDTSDRLYFESLTLEDVLEIVHIEKPKGVIVQYGGQTPLKLARALEAAGVPIIGTSPDSIDLAEDRERFQNLLERLGLKQPPNATARSVEQAVTAAKDLGYPLVVRPSYVLGGRGMEIVFNEEGLQRYMKEAVSVSNDAPVLLDRFLDDAVEMDVDAIYDGERILIGGLMEHIEQAGVHSGDSACSLPPYDLAPEIQDKLRDQVAKMAEALGVRGLMNTQFAIQGQDIYVLEVNPRASRTAPFVSKATGYALAKIAARVMVGQTLEQQGATEERIPSYYSVKEAVFPFVKFPGVDPLLGPEMKSTGEVMGVGKTFGEAFAKSQRAAGVNLNDSGKVLISIRDADKAKAPDIARMLVDKKYEIVATGGTARFLKESGIPCEVVYKVNEGRPNTVDMIKNDQIQLIINTTEGKKAISDSFAMRREALQHRVTYYTTMAGARAACYALGELDAGDVNCLQDLHKT